MIAFLIIRIHNKKIVVSKVPSYAYVNPKLYFVITMTLHQRLGI